MTYQIIIRSKKTGIDIIIPAIIKNEKLICAWINGVFYPVDKLTKEFCMFRNYDAQRSLLTY